MRQDDHGQRDRDVPQGVPAAGQHGWDHNPGGGGDDLDMVVHMYSVAVLKNFVHVLGKGPGQR